MPLHSLDDREHVHLTKKLMIVLKHHYERLSTILHDEANIFSKAVTSVSLDNGDRGVRLVLLF